ncbi:MAG: hypothetical protein J3Q66DRAFT_439500 [Benniella sp.]|nr:MAG: hypothetical protein J3Q66DRAFT_439500 [Benniella sp.]
MPALTDKIFLPISIFVLNVVLAAFKFVLANAVGACFAIYAMRGCEYAKSVGWIRSAGYRGMITTSYNTFKRKNVPGSVKLALIVAFIATLVANFLDKGISSLVHPGFRLGQPTKDVVVSPQAEHSGIFFGWSFVVPGNGSVVGTMKQSLNSSIANPRADDGYVYSPVISEYTPVCTDFEFQFEKEIMRNGSGCGWVKIYFPTNFVNSPIKTERSPNRWSITMASSQLDSDHPATEQPASGYLYFVDPTSFDRKANDFCSFKEDYRDNYEYVRTTITKCVRDNGDIAVVAMTATRLISYVAEFDSVAAKTYSTYHSDDLLSTMNKTIRTKAITAPPVQEPHNLMAEIRVANSTTEAFVCGVYEKPDGDVSLCVYFTIAVHIFKQPVLNDQIQGAIDRLKRLVQFANYHMVLEYFPELTEDNTLAPISTKKMRNDTVAVADYMAQIGSSFFANFYEKKVYILYDKAEIETGLEIPLWVLIAAGIIMLVSFCLWQLTHWFVGPPHTSSLYSIVRTRLAETSGTPFPRLMRFKLPLTFEDVYLLPDQFENLPDETETLPDETGTLPEDIKSERVQDKENK